MGGNGMVWIEWPQRFEIKSFLSTEFVLCGSNIFEFVLQTHLLRVRIRTIGWLLNCEGRNWVWNGKKAAGISQIKGNLCNNNAICLCTFHFIVLGALSIISSFFSLLFVVSAKRNWFQFYPVEDNFHIQNKYGIMEI